MTDKNKSSDQVLKSAKQPDNQSPLPICQSNSLNESQILDCSDEKPLLLQGISAEKRPGQMIEHAMPIHSYRVHFTEVFFIRRVLHDRLPTTVLEIP